MSIALTTVFGSQVSVSFQPRRAHRLRSAFSGANGLTDVMLGTRGYPIVVTGVLYGSGVNYAAARADIVSQIEGIEAYLWDPEEDYTYFNETHYNVVLDRIELIPSGNPPRVFRQTADGYAMVQFIALLTSLA